MPACLGGLMTVEELQCSAWFSEFEQKGESFVRMAVESFEYENQRDKRSAAREWLRLREDSRASSTSRWARHAAYAAYAAAIIAAASMITTIVMAVLH